jgi:hypothetical protein
MGHAYCPYCDTSYCGLWHDKDDPHITYRKAEDVFIPIATITALPEHHMQMFYHKADHDLCWSMPEFSAMNLIPRPYKDWIRLAEAFPCVTHFYPSTIPCNGESLKLAELHIARRSVQMYYTYNGPDPRSYCYACKSSLPYNKYASCPHCGIQYKRTGHSIRYPECVCVHTHVNPLAHPAAGALEGDEEDEEETP